jgi:uncharacterized damage-inducible protein DinB
MHINADPGDQANNFPQMIIVTRGSFHARLDREIPSTMRHSMTPIRRVWRGWASQDRADAYEALLLQEVLPGIAARRLCGYLGASVGRRDTSDGVEFMTILEFESLEPVRMLAGEDLEVAHVPDAARALLTDFDSRATHYTVLMGANGAASARPSPGDLAARIRSVVEGGMWHGPSIKEAVEGVGATIAAAHPIEGAHSIWELILHVGNWAEIVAERLAGRDPQVTPDRNFPPVAEATEASWCAAVDRTKKLYLALAEHVDGLNASTLWKGREEDSPHPAAQIQGVIEHGAYHAGQIVLLRRAAGAWSAE